jgi:hypothetical protein
MAADLFSYTESWADAEYKKYIYKHIRIEYFLKSLILLPLVPFDIFYIVLYLIFSSRTDVKYVFCSMKAYKQFRAIPEFLHEETIIVTDPFSAIKQFNSNCIYIPASLIYLGCGLLPWRGAWRQVSNKIILGSTSLILRTMLGKRKFVLICHSDSLPFARALIFIGKKSGAIIACLQHGIFHEKYDVEELCGSLSDINVVRSDYDADLIRKRNPNSKYLVTPQFFEVRINKLQNNIIKPIILVGEGLHMVSKTLANKYLVRLKEIESELLDLGFVVQYRPHPSEKLRCHFFGFNSIDSKELAESFATAQAYIGYSSSLIVEASSIGVPCYIVEIDGIYNSSMNRIFGNKKVVLEYNVKQFNYPQPKVFFTKFDDNLLVKQHFLILDEIKRQLK